MIRSGLIHTERLRKGLPLHWQNQDRELGMRATISVQFLTLSCSFRQWRIYIVKFSSTSGKSWIRYCSVYILSNNKLAYFLQGWRPSLGNPGSVTVWPLQSVDVDFTIEIYRISPVATHCKCIRERWKWWNYLEYSHVSKANAKTIWLINDSFEFITGRTFVCKKCWSSEKEFLLFRKFASAFHFVLIQCD